MPLETPWVLHDLRRSGVTGMCELGVAPHVVEAVVNHVSGHKAGVAGVYNRSTYATEKRVAPCSAGPITCSRLASATTSSRSGGDVPVQPARSTITCCAASRHCGRSRTMPSLRAEVRALGGLIEIALREAFGLTLIDDAGARRKPSTRTG